MSISSGTYNIGSGEEYVTIDLAIAQLAATLTGNLTLKYTSAVTESVANSITTNLGGYNLTITTDSVHSGDVTAGILISINTSAFWIDDTTTNGNFIINHLKFKKLSNYRSISKNSGSTSTSKFHDNFYDGNSLSTAAFQFLGTAIECWNCVFKGIAGDAVLFRATTNTVRNILVHTCKYGIELYGSGGTVSSCATFGTLTDSFYSVLNAYGYNNACADLTGEDADFKAGSSGNLTSLTLANEFFTDDTNGATYGRPKRTGSCYRNGNTTHLSTVDMTGRLWDIQNPSIGAFQDTNIYYCDPAASGSNDGSSWTNAFTSLQSFFSIANSDYVCYMRGTQLLSSALSLTRHAGDTYNAPVVIGCNASGVEDGSFATINAQGTVSNCIVQTTYGARCYKFLNIHFTNSSSVCIQQNNEYYGLLFYNCKFSNSGSWVTLCYSVSFIHCTFLDNVGISQGYGVNYLNIIEECLAIHNSVVGTDVFFQGAIINSIFHGHVGATGINTCNNYFNSSIVSNCIIDGYKYGLASSTDGAVYSYCRITNSVTEGIYLNTSAKSPTVFNDCYFYNPGTSDYTANQPYLISLDDTYNLITSENTEDGYKDRAGLDFSLTSGKAGVMVKKTVGAKDSTLYGYYTSGIPPLAQAGGRQPRGSLHGI